MKHFRHCFSGFGHLLRVVALSSLLVLPVGMARAQDGNCVGAPCNLSVESTEPGVLLSWQAPVSKDDQGSSFFEITNYEITGSHVRQGAGVVARVSGATNGQVTVWLDRQATDPGLLYVYRVRAAFDGEPGPWSGFVNSGFQPPAIPPTPEVPPEPTATPNDPFAQFTAQAMTLEPTSAGPEPGPTLPAPAAPLQPTAPPPPPEPTATPADPLAQFTAQAPQNEPTAAPPEPEATAVPPAAPEQEQARDEPPAPTAAPPPGEATAGPPVVVVEPTAPPPPPEPTAAPPEPEATAVPPAAPEQEQARDEPPAPTAAPPPGEATAGPPVVVVEPTAPTPPPEPTAVSADPFAELTAQAPGGAPEGEGPGT